MQRKRLWRRVLWFSLGLFLAYVAACWMLSSKYLYPGADDAGEVPKGLVDRKLPLGGGEIPAWTTPSVESNPRQTSYVLVHGYQGSQAYWHDIARDLAKDGHGVVVPVLPAHHDPVEKSTGFGTKESDRVADVVRWLRAKDGSEHRRIVLVGISMGAAACWLATEKVKVDAVVSEGGFAWFETAALGWLDRAVPGGSVVLRPVVWFASARSGISMSSIVPVESARNWRGKPALVIQGDQDIVTPMFHARALAEAAACPIWVVEGARHADCPVVAGSEYVRRLEGFATSR